MSSIMDQLAARKGAAAAEKKTSKKTSKRLKTVSEEATKSFEIAEADIQSNVAYAVITDPKLSDQKKLEKLEELKVYNKELPKEANEAKTQAVNEALLYIENQLMASSQKGIEFTNDNAFALYDDTIKELFGNIHKFKGYIEPFVKALQVLQEARDKGLSASDLIQGVEEIQNQIDSMKSDKESKESELSDAQTELNTLNQKAEEMTRDLKDLAAKVEAAKTEKANAEKSWKVWSKGNAVANAKADVELYTSQINTLEKNSKSNAETLETQNTKIEVLTVEIAKLDTEIANAQETFDADEDSVAIATLIEITGDDFKDKREEVVTAAQTITEKAITGIETSISRFDSGKEETGQQLNTVTNLNGMVSLLTAADKKAEVANRKFISEQKEIVDRIFAEKGEDAVRDPDYQVAKEHLDNATEYVEGVDSTSVRSVDLSGKLTKQSGTFRGLRNAYDQKKQDATRLRTSAAVEIPAQLAVTVKSVEMATATESNNMVNDAFADLSKTTQESVSSIFDTVSAGAGQNNEQLRATLESTMNTIEMMNAVEADLKQKAAENYEVRQDLNVAQSALKDVTDAVASASTDAKHEEMAKDEATEANKNAPKPTI